MLNRLKRRIGRFFRQSRTVHNEPINKVSLGIIILIDLFILGNVFVGLNDIGQWYISPSQAHDCYFAWRSYRESDLEFKDYIHLRDGLQLQPFPESSLTAVYERTAANHLGTVADLCWQYATQQDALNTPDNRAAVSEHEELRTEIDRLADANRTIRDQYDSTLLEDIAGQPPAQSINQVDAAEARQTLDRNTGQIATLEAEQQALQAVVITSPAGDRFLNFLQDDAQFQTLEQAYEQAQFWYPSIQILFQSLFLVPLLVLSTAVHRYSQRRGYGLVALLSWHLTIIFCIPLIVKFFQFLQVGALFAALARVVGALLGGLLFLVSYLYILAIPLLGFGLIKFCQRVVLNPKVQAAGRVQKSRCIHCGKKIHREDHYCVHCGYGQLTECNHCHSLTYKYLPYCRECGAPQSS